MDYNKAALEMHETHHGKVGITSKVEVRTRDDLSTAYTPGVAEPCRKIKENPDDVYKYTFKGNMSTRLLQILMQDKQIHLVVQKYSP